MPLLDSYSKNAIRQPCKSLNPFHVPLNYYRAALQKPQPFPPATQSLSNSPVHNSVQKIDSQKNSLLCLKNRTNKAFLYRRMIAAQGLPQRQSSRLASFLSFLVESLGPYLRNCKENTRKGLAESGEIAWNTYGERNPMLCGLSFAFLPSLLRKEIHVFEPNY